MIMPSDSGSGDDGVADSHNRLDIRFIDLPPCVRSNAVVAGALFRPG
jgi:hypothetical protein